MSRDRKKKPHSFNAKFIHWWYCTKCGLISLKNDATKKDMKQSCPGADKADV